MKRPNFNCIKYDTLIELNDLKTYLEDLNKYCDFIETENQQLKLCEVVVTEGGFCGICKQSFDIVAGKICEHERCVRYR